MRFELTRVAPYAPQTYASTSFATPAATLIISMRGKTLQEGSLQIREIAAEIDGFPRMQSPSNQANCGKNAHAAPK